MNVSYRWLAAVAPGLDNRSPEEVAERLARRGAPVEGVERLGGGLTGILVARVEAVRDHPGADRLVLCDVTAGENGGDEVLQVVCGAPNVRAGRLYPFAPVGATLPGGMQIRKAKIRGERSEGMLCSERELRLGADESGLMELPPELGVGSSLIDALSLDDVRFDVEVTPNRGDLLSHLGVARELVPEGDRGLVLPPIPGRERGAERALEAGTLDVKAGKEEVGSEDLTIRIEDPEACHRYLGAVVRGVRIAPSPPWLASRLRAVGARPVNNVVDATNYVLLEMGQPLHAFDLARVRGRRIEVRGARAGEGVLTLDDEQRDLSPDMLCICDAEGPAAIAGVIGGMDSAVGEDTSDILLECAWFEPRQVRATRMALGISTDSSYRFERGVDPDAMTVALGRAIELVLATAGGEVDAPILDAHPRAAEELVVGLRPERVERVLGVPFSKDELRSLLEPLGFSSGEGEGRAAAEGKGSSAAGRNREGTEERAEIVELRVPGWRRYDVTREVDLVEEVARAHGYDSFPAELGSYRPGTVPDDPLFLASDRIRDLLVARGFFEAQTPSFAPSSEGNVELVNPISSEESHLRSSLLPGLVRRVERNLARGIRDVRLFEIGTCFFPGDGNGGGAEDEAIAADRRAGERSGPGLPTERTRVAIVATGRRRPPHWSEPGGECLDVWDTKAWLEDLLGPAGLHDGVVRPGVNGDDEMGVPLAPDLGYTVTSAAVEGEDGPAVPVGRAGRVREGVADTPPWAHPLWALEITLPESPDPAPVTVYAEPSPFPGVSRDLAIIVPDDLPADRVRRVIEGAAGPHLSAVEVFDLYRGEGIPPETRSIGFRLHFSSPERTLTDHAVDEAADDVVRTLEEELGVRPRT